MNLGYILNVKYLASKLELHHIEEVISKALGTRRKNSRDVEEKSSLMLIEDGRILIYLRIISLEAVLECPEEETPSQASLKDMKNQLDLLRHQFNEIRDSYQDIAIHVQVRFFM